MPFHTPEQLAEVLSYDSETGYLVWSVKTNSRAKAGARICHLNNHGYLMVTYQKKVYLAHRVAWALHHGEWPNGLIDHKNCVKTDNRIANLRIASAAQNVMNRPVCKRIALSLADRGGQYGSQADAVDACGEAIITGRTA